ncbi:hypothetical protein [Pseudoalteromonas spongiae]|uniref:Uncharacterized protein n=1 Tax=Pseudoalteromonas spongiae TaxID=298657 RepID=A0ABU8ER79_9GAMM
MTPIEEFEIRLMRVNPEEDNFALQIDELVESVPDELFEALIPSIFRFFEKHSLQDCGMPGTLVHLVEDFYPSYKSLLLDSLEKAPSLNAILMTNRILNSQLSPHERQEYTSALEAIRDNTNVHSELRKEAKEFIEYQNS